MLRLRSSSLGLLNTRQESKHAHEGLHYDTLVTNIAYTLYIESYSGEHHWGEVRQDKLTFLIPLCEAYSENLSRELINMCQMYLCIK